MATNSVVQANVIDLKPEQIRHDLLRPVFHTSRRYYALVFFLVAFGLPGIFAYMYQMSRGMSVAGITRPVFWGFYITNFVFWIGISHAGTLISAILRLVNATWRRPVTRCAEAITVFALAIGAQYPIIHLGRSWLFFWLVPYPSERGIWPNFRSPLVWDFFAISTYLTGSVTFLLLPIIPDWAMVRDRATGLRTRIYTVLALGWRGTPREWHRLEMAMRIMAVVILPVAVSVHTIVSWDFAMAPVPMWHSTVFGPYFVAGAIFSGIAALIVAMALLRKLLHLEEYLKPSHFDNLGKLLLVMSLLWLYFIFAERLTVWYGNQPSEMAAFLSIQRGRFAVLFWTMIFCNFLIPFPILAIKKLRTIAGTVIASSTIVVGMWLERFLIVVPPLEHKNLPYDWGSYRPTWVEITITVGTLTGMILLYVLFAKFVPIISIWELKGGQHARPLPDQPQAAVSRAGVRLNSTLSSSINAIYGLFPDSNSARRAVAAFRAESSRLRIKPQAIVIMSSEPLEEEGFGWKEQRTPMPWLAPLGALLGGAGGYALAAFTQRTYPLPTGNMPIVAMWPTGIIMYELTMFGAIFTTIVTFLISARLPNYGKRLYDREVTNGKILVGVADPDRDCSGEIEQRLQREGAEQVKEFSND